jgi:hypothetical protein
MVQTIVNGFAVAVVIVLCVLLIDVTQSSAEDRALLLIQEAETMRLEEEVAKHVRLGEEYTTAIQNLFAYTQACDAEIANLRRKGQF